MSLSIRNSAEELPRRVCESPLWRGILPRAGAAKDRVPWRSLPVCRCLGKAADRMRLQTGNRWMRPGCVAARRCSFVHKLCFDNLRRLLGIGKPKDWKKKKSGWKKKKKKKKDWERERGYDIIIINHSHLRERERGFDIISTTITSEKGGGGGGGGGEERYRGWKENEAKTL